MRASLPPGLAPADPCPACVYLADMEETALGAITNALPDNERLRAEVGPAVTIVAATKYLALEDMAVLAEAGVEVVGENRAQDLEAKHARFGDAFRWHFIGHLQSRKARAVSELCELVHSLDSESAARRRRVAVAHAGSERAAVPMARAGPETGQGPRASRKVSAMGPGARMAKPRRRPARPQNLPKLFRTTVPGSMVRAM